MIAETDLTEDQRVELRLAARGRAEACDAINRETGQSHEEKLELLTQVFYDWMLAWGELVPIAWDGGTAVTTNGVSGGDSEPT